MSKVMLWVDEELARDATLGRKVAAELARLRVEQDLVALRERQGLSHRELARRVGVCQPVIARIEPVEPAISSCARSSGSRRR
jgi:ribosome-binding protein aMBF1 (putative translation factor)